MPSPVSSTRFLSSTFLVVLALGLQATRASAWQAPPSAPPLVESFDDDGLTVTLPAGFVADKDPAKLPLVRGWKGRLGASQIGAELLLIDAADYKFEEPEDVSDTWCDDMREKEGKRGGRIAFGSPECVSGAYGWAGYAALVRGTRHPKDGGAAHGVFLASGLTKQKAWTLRLDVEPDPKAGPNDADAQAIRDLLIKAVAYRGEVRDPKWKDAELQWRWMKYAPESTKKKLERPARSEHYVVLANCPNGTAFAKKLEGYYAAVKKAIPFQEVPGRKLLPIYLFRTEDEYYDYYVRRYESTRTVAEEKWGHLEGIYYVSYFEDLDNPIHCYYATLQILHARLRLDGGGSWFAAGIAEYMSTKPAQRTPAAKKAKSGEHIPFADLIRIAGLAETTARQDLTGVDDVDIRFAEAALVIEFLRESKWAKDKFPLFVQTVGVVEDQDFAGIEAAIRTVYGTDLSGLEKQWIEYCKKR